MGLGHSPRIVTNGLIGYWDAGNARSYPGSGTTWTDLSGNGNTGTLYNSPTYSSNNGGYLSFNGTTQYVGCGSNYNSISTNGVSYCVWFQVPNYTSFHRLVTLNNTTNTDYDQYIQVSVTSGVISSGTNTNSGYKVATTPVGTNRWNYAVATFDKTTINIYLNGVNDGGTTTGTPVMNSSFGNLEIARLVAVSVYYYGAPFIANVSMYNRALSAIEVKQNYNALRGRFGI